MINKSAAVRSGQYLALELLSTAISSMNKTAPENKYMIVADEKDLEPTILNGDILLTVTVFCNAVSIYTKQKQFSKDLSKESLKKLIGGQVSATIIIEFLQSGCVNYRLMTDALTEKGAQTVPGMDRISLIKKIIAYPANSEAGLSRGWSFTFDGDVAGIRGDWDIRQLLDTSYEEMIKCYGELRGLN